MRLSLLCCLLASLLFTAACRKNTTPAPTNPPVLPQPAIIPPINDLGTASWRGRQGGLYPNGLNTRPVAHQQAGEAIAQGIRPLDASGAADATNGRIVWLAIGMSNTTQEASVFINLSNNLHNRHPRLSLVDGAQGGWDIDMINNPAALYWDNVVTRLSQQGLTPAQVQIVWLKQADRSFPDTSFAGYTARYRDKLATTIGIIRSKFPNVKLLYLSSRIYAGYQTGTGSNPEPYACYTGWGVKDLIAEQINGNPAYAYAGSGAPMPWLSWAAYTWAHGNRVRGDGLRWLREDFEPDGIHPSNSGRRKVAELLLQFFTTDATARPWFVQP
ncbi:MAG TPA: hypothetical protein PKE63_00660 [Lacibacter sp.]|nr:hypothetical protein [Lacibacter sp.]HMO88337.1 hypothetical protein [Lacibacter sp.]HMP85753.1 hypothetical protein [Lacibacter sp.]